MQTMVPLYGFGGVPYSAVRKAVPPNLLDNSDFTNLVAQAGIGGDHGSVAYAADRWILTSGTISYEAGVGLTLDGTITQKLERIPEEATPAVGMVSGTAEIRFSNGAVEITSSGGVLKWAALYEGTYTAAAMPEYQPKGYGAELRECQRYFMKFASGAQYLGYTSSTTGGIIDLYVPSVFRATPSLSITGINWLRVNGTHYGSPTATFNISFMRTGLVGLSVTGLSITVPQYVAFFIALGEFSLSADL
ncbi:MAG: hypothetical protein Q4F81_01415 [Eubacteriales bacterium]|nr:hypothetical protein [Eubacteriales bacterium]